ncbi:hypothetical protein PsorP6_003795 [Peronosclerospora sorghi]|uniref:Uncharacterized protein n=1 Tax=Peronosclerospora sorghi TaxID=230839 RepID=A0ACC0VKK5_9STRA|nr:hypothetical protein PsorP6_003795 [Peronosclerospora sorghi]
MIPCSLVEDAADPTTLTCHTMVEVSNTTTSRRCIAVYDDQGNHVAGFVEDTKLVNTQAVQTLMKSRNLQPKRQELSIQELDSLIAQFIAQDVQHFKTHEDLLATIQVQPAYLRQMYKLPPAWLDGTYHLHAVYRATRGMVLPATLTDPLEYLRAKFNVPTATPL